MEKATNLGKFLSEKEKSKFIEGQMENAWWTNYWEGWVRWKGRYNLNSGNLSWKISDVEASNSSFHFAQRYEKKSQIAITTSESTYEKSEVYKEL